MKILISPGFGAGWSTWLDCDTKEKLVFALTCPYLIEALDAGETLGEDHPLVKQFQSEWVTRFGEIDVYVGGAGDLIVTDVSGQFAVREYDGSESVETPQNDGWLNADTDFGD